MAPFPGVSARALPRLATCMSSWAEFLLLLLSLSSSISPTRAITCQVVLPNLLPDIRAIVDSQSQADPQFRSHRLYTRLTAAEVRRQLIAQKGYADAALPTVETIGTKLNALGYYPQKVAKSQPQKNFRKPTRSST